MNLVVLDVEVLQLSSRVNLAKFSNQMPQFIQLESLLNLIVCSEQQNH